ncbi:putative telomerase reverse transcriptase [Colletotrichum karsti]|uniref:Telomerase reverse transcriptase n=1 Tax=Colletotrichum karsti TaxID=1095194 RepID=A0A9P6I8U8_9PEZI|nr:putative telomerase reverse transcriptase [Colletotrichum karsti]KAF9878997.1 putative telomerase reverse transcriptase [Colletotrichum karsti]
MAPKRKAQQPPQKPALSKRVKVEPIKTPVKHSVLLQYYGDDNVWTLRDYLLAKLPASSRLRRRKIASIGKSVASLTQATLPVEDDLSKLLDTIILWKSSQKGDESILSLSGGLNEANDMQRELVDFVVWQLFSRVQLGAWPKHLLCDGFRRGQNARPHPVHTNQFVETLTDSPWPQLLMLLGKSGEQIMIDLLSDTAIFKPVQAGAGNLYQLSGTPMFERQGKEGPKKDSCLGYERSPSEISFMRNRMLYARAALTGRGTVHYGLRHIHVLSRCPLLSCNEEAAAERRLHMELNNDKNTLKVMMYIFPRQFDLHNVFTSKVDHLKTAQKLPDYTLREEEIAKVAKDRQIKTPKRLRGDVKRLVQQMQLFHSRCSYAELLRHYCPSAIDSKAQHPLEKKLPSQSQKFVSSQSLGSSTQRTTSTGRSKMTTEIGNTQRQQVPPTPVIEFDTITDLATPTAHVSAFCRAVLAKIIPNEFWGVGDTQTHNRNAIFKKVDHFIKLRRFESMSLEEVMEGLKVTNMEWLAPPKLKGLKTSQGDMKKRLEILHDNFYITESSSDRYRLFFFRHDIWRYVAEPAMANLRSKMFEEVKLNEAERILGSRQLGFSRIRLLPKGKSIRPIMNLRRRATVNGKGALLGPSINSILGPVHSVLKLEAELNPTKLGSSMLCVGDVYPRLNAFKASFGEEPQEFFFAKVDVQSAFDTIPQNAVVRLMGGIPRNERYVLRKHMEVKASLVDSRNQKRPDTKLPRRWHSLAATLNDPASFAQVVEDRLGLKRKNAVFVGNLSRKEYDKQNLLALMASHIQQNLVKVGKKYYRQKNGIPQGSVLSSSLCNYFYADLEEQRLPFLVGEDSLLLRLIDDFLFISTNQKKARKFVQVMHGGVPEYGVTVNPAKTLVNFDLELRGMKISRVSESAHFPYCGLKIDCQTLDIVKDRENVKRMSVADALTVDFGHKPGQNFQRRIINAFKIQSHLMFYDTKHNALNTVITNLHKAFMETADKMMAYWRCLPVGKRPTESLLTQTISKVIEAAFMLLTSRARKERHPGYSCALEKTHVTWLGLDATRKVIMKKQAKLAQVLGWIDVELSKLNWKKTARVTKIIK